MYASLIYWNDANSEPKRKGMAVNGSSYGRVGNKFDTRKYPRAMIFVSKKKKKQCDHQVNLHSNLLNFKQILIECQLISIKGFEKDRSKNVKSNTVTSSDYPLALNMLAICVCSRKVLSFNVALLSEFICYAFLTDSYNYYWSRVYIFVCMHAPFIRNRQQALLLVYV